jgi:predicted phage terminase large subunit-like protein
MVQEKAYTLKDFEDHCRRVSESTSNLPTETAEQKDKRIKRLLGNYGEFFEFYLEYYCKGKDGKVTKCAWYHIYVAHLLLKFPVIHLILEWFRGSAKSIHADLGYPLFLWAHNELMCMILIGQNNTIANILLSDIQAQFEHNGLFKNDFGDQKSIGSWETGEFKTRNGAGFFARGMGQTVRGTRNGPHRPDYIVADDLDTSKLSRNSEMIKEAVDWLNDEVLGTFDVGNQRFILVNNGPFPKSILRSMVEEKFVASAKIGIRTLMRNILAPGAFSYQVKNIWHHLRVNAVDKDFNPSWPEKYTKEYWVNFAKGKTSRSWLREWMNTPVTVGGIFQDKWVQWKRMQPLKNYSRLIHYVDPSAKDLGDYKAAMLWGSYNTELHKIKAFLRQCSRLDLIKYLYDTYEMVRDKKAILTTQIEGNFAQDELFRDEIYAEGIRRGYQLPYTFDTRKKDNKFERIESTSSHYQNHLVFWNEEEKNTEDMKESKDQLIAIAQGGKMHDDGPDADEAAIFYLMEKRRASASEPRSGTIKRDSAM